MTTKLNEILRSGILERHGLVKFFGILRCAQDDTFKNNAAEQKGWPRRSLSRSTGPRASSRRPVSRILSGCLHILDGHSSRRSIAASLQQPTRRFQHAALLQRIRLGASGRYAAAVWIEPRSPCLFGLAPCGVYPAAAVTGGAVRSYRTFSPLPSKRTEGGIFSVARAVSHP
jgi:hypothetical protein